MTGSSGFIQFGKQGSTKFRWGTWVTWHSPEFELNDVGYQQRSDAMFEVIWLNYRWTEPFSIFRNLNIGIDQWSSWDFGLNNSFYGFSTNTFMQFKNHWSFGAGLNFEGDATSNTTLRGGPSIKSPGGGNYWIHFGTDRRKKLQIFGNTGSSWGFEDSRKSNWYGIDLIYRPFDALRISLMPDFSTSTNEMQYIDMQEYNGEDRYVFAQIDRITTDLTVRIDYTITPDLTIQFYGSPFVSTGDYSDPKYITDPKAEKFKDRYSTDMSWSTDDYENGYDFNFKQFRSNLVMRWEYRPGSLLYLVWTQSKTGYDETGDFEFYNDFSKLFNLHPYNVFLVKLTFRFAN